MRKFLSSRTIAYTIVLLIVIIGGRILFPVPLLNIQLPAEKIPGLPITNAFVATLLADLTLLVIVAVVTRRLGVEPPGLETLGGKITNLVEWGVEGFHGLARDIAGSNVVRFFPLFMSIFLFILVANWWELVPGFDSIGALEHPHEEGMTAYQVSRQIGPVSFLSATPAEHGEEGYILVPFLRAAPTDLNLPLGLALISMTYVQIMGIRFLRGGYLRKFFVNPLRDGLGTFVGLLELISEFAKIISLTFRLFGNIFAGSVLLIVMPFLIPFLIPLPFYGLEMFVGFMQAFVFAILTLVFTSQAVVSHEAHDHEKEHS